MACDGTAVGLPIIVDFKLIFVGKNLNMLNENPINLKLKQANLKYRVKRVPTTLNCYFSIINS